jgi:lysophospholipase L1-like esterase
MFWYEEEVRLLEKRIQKEIIEPDNVVFYGSSSIRLWTTLAQDFPEHKPVNLGFGGSTLAACAWFFDRLVMPAHPTSLIFYAGDNDLGDGRHPEEVYLFFCAFAEKMARQLPGVRLSFMAIKASPARWSLVDRIRFANEMIRKKIAELPFCTYIDVHTPMLDAAGRPRRELFEADGLHLSKAGYQVWKQVLLQHPEIF